MGLFDSSERFLRFCEPFQQLTNSQSLQDLFALYCNGPGRGYFLEFGLANGTRFSNTLLLELLGWRGLGGEPNPLLREEARRRRSIPVVAEALYNRSGEVLRFACNGLYGGLDQTAERREQAARAEYTDSIDVTTITLGDLLDREKAPKIINYFSLDVEGAEEMILENLPLERYQFSCLTVEHNYSPERRKIRDLMKQQGFRRVFREISAHDDWYVNRSMRFRGWSRQLINRLDDERGRIHLARCQAACLEQRDRAIATLYATIYSRPRPHPRSFLELSRLLMQAGREQEARELLGRARDLHPSNARLNQSLERLQPGPAPEELQRNSGDGSNSYREGGD